MSIAIIGNGKVGQALANTLQRAGRAVHFGARNPEGAALNISDAIAQAKVVILAVPFSAVGDIFAQTPELTGKIIIDATNPLAMGAHGLHLTLGFETSGAEQIAARARGAHVFKAFNQTGFENLGDAGAYPKLPVMFVAGDDAAAKPVVLSLVADCGFEAIDIGPLRQARLLEPLAMLWIELARKAGRGPHFAFAIENKE